MRKTAVLTLATLLFALPGVTAEVRPEVRAKAAGILDALKRIEAERGRPAAALRSLTFTEAEFNAYVVCRLDAENEPFVKVAEFKLLADDHIEGRITIDLGDRRSSGLLPKRQDLLFSAGIETRDGKIKISMDKLFLGTQPIAPAVVDVIIGVVSRLQGVEPTSLEDWYDLPPGVRKLESRAGQVVVYY
ncbi:MAG: hypothetical protein IMZ54_10015 [Acidobacteria bacterium]|nr:hypothetical protein [Acidobacteriota bacterium]MBE3131033.1 hypothetical protein [Acidobacteriota bacterium]